MDYAILVMISVAIGAGVFGAIARGWSLSSRLYSLDDRMSLVETNLLREVRARAAGARWTKRDEQEDLIQQALLDQPKQQPLMWWQKAAQSLPRSVEQK